MTRPHVVVVTPEVDARPTSGGSLRTLRLVQSLARRADVDLLVVDHAADTDELARVSGARSVTLHARTGGRLRVRLRALLRGWPLDAARRYSRDAVRSARAAGDAGATVVLEHVYLDGYRPRRAPYVLSTQNAEAAVRRSLPAEASVLRRLERRYDLVALAGFERRAVRRANAVVVTVSDADTTALGVAAAVVANGTDLPASVSPLPAGGRLTYVGSMTWAPNRLAVEWWRTEVAPLLPDDLPRLTVVGRGGRAAFGGAADLDVLDVVPDMAAVLAETRLAVVPLLHGSGTRLKILEAMAHGRPVVTTSKGAEGLPVRDGEHLLVADDPAAFADAVTRLWRDDELAGRLVAGGRSLVQGYGWTALGEQFADVVLAARP